MKASYFQHDDVRVFDNPQRVLITGADGMLGRAFCRQIACHAPLWEVRALNRTSWDVTDPNPVQALAEWIKGGWVVHCAALVNVEECARHPQRARAVIVDGAANASAIARVAGATLLYPQSFLIYDGVDNPITEQTNPAPLSIYGRLKLEAEVNIRQQVEQHLVLRMAGFFGGEERDKNFVGKIIPQLATAVQMGTANFPVGDRMWQPTYTDDLAYNAILLMGHAKRGTYQMASHGEATFYEVACRIVTALRWSGRIALTKASPHDVTQNELGRRPGKAIMVNRRLQAEGLDRQRSWRVSLDEYLAREYFNRYRTN